MYIRAPQAAADWIKEHNRDGTLTNDWVEGGGIARHCLALREDRPLVGKGTRFIVEGNETPMHRKLVMRGSADELVFEWLARFASDPDKVLTRYKGANEPPRAQIGEDQVLVNTQGVVDCLDAYKLSDNKKLSAQRIGKALKKFSIGQTRPRELGLIRFYSVKPDMVIEWAMDNQVGDEDKINANLKRDLKRC